MRGFPSVLRALSCIVLAAGTVAIAAAADPAAEAVRAVDRIARGDFAAAVERLDDSLREDLTQASLAELWRSLESQAGRFRRRGDPTTQTVKGLPVVSVPLEFERTGLAARVSFDAQGRIAGLQFLPAASARPAYRPPSYVKPDAFTEKEIVAGARDWPLPATLSMPQGKGPFPAVVLVHDDGALDRDASVGGLKVFRDIAGGLASRGIAVLRYDKRTREHPNKPVETVREAVIDDAVAAVDLLGKTAGIDPDRLFVAGHGLGGTMAPEIAKRVPSLAGIVSLAGAARAPDEALVQQAAYLLEQRRAPAEERDRKLAALRADLARARRPAAEGEADEPIQGVSAAYWRDWLTYRPLDEARASKVPFLIVHAERDYETTAEDLAGWKKALGQRSGVTFKTYKKLNHLLVEGDGASTSEEYEKPGSVAAAAVGDLADWILKQRPRARDDAKP